MQSHNLFLLKWPWVKKVVSLRGKVVIFKNCLFLLKIKKPRTENPSQESINFIERMIHRCSIVILAWDHLTSFWTFLCYFLVCNFIFGDHFVQFGNHFYWNSGLWNCDLGQNIEVRQQEKSCSYPVGFRIKLNSQVIKFYLKIYDINKVNLYIIPFIWVSFNRFTLKNVLNKLINQKLKFFQNISIIQITILAWDHTARFWTFSGLQF